MSGQVVRVHEIEDVVNGEYWTVWVSVLVESAEFEELFGYVVHKVVTRHTPEVSSIIIQVLTVK